MEKQEIESLLNQVLEKESDPYDLPTQQDWDVLADKFNYDFSEEFMFFINSMSFYMFPGDVYNAVRQGRTNGNGNVAQVYDRLMADEDRGGIPWNPDLIPFYGVGGDFYCLSIRHGKHTPVYYVYHEDGHAEEEYSSFDAFLKGLPDLLSD